MDDERLQPETDVLEVVSDSSADVVDGSQDGLSNLLGSVAGSLGSIDGNLSELRRGTEEGFGTLGSRLESLESGQALLSDQLNGTAEGVQDDGNENRTYVVEIESNQLAALQSHIERNGNIGSVSLFVSLLCTLLVAALLGSSLWTTFSRGWRR